MCHHTDLYILISINVTPDSFASTFSALLVKHVLSALRIASFKLFKKVCPRCASSVFPVAATGKTVDVVTLNVKPFQVPWSYCRAIITVDVNSQLMLTSQISTCHFICVQFSLSNVTRSINPIRPGSSSLLKHSSSESVYQIPKIWRFLQEILSLSFGIWINHSRVLDAASHKHREEIINR